jgi:hypothetical protein
MAAAVLVATMPPHMRQTSRVGSLVDAVCSVLFDEVFGTREGYRHDVVQRFGSGWQQNAPAPQEDRKDDPKVR